MQSSWDDDYNKCLFRGRNQEQAFDKIYANRNDSSLVVLSHKDSLPDRSQ